MMNTTPRHKIIVHRDTKGWTWTQVSRNGMSGAIAPAPFDTKSNAKRAADRQAAALNWGHVAYQPINETPKLPDDAAVVVVLEHYRRA